MPDTDPDDGAHLRISDRERHEVAELLRDAAAEGRLDLDELEERLEATYAAKTYGELVPLTADLPDARPPRPAGPTGGVAPRVPPPHLSPASRPVGPPAPVGPVPRRGTSVAVMSSCDRRGVWQPDGDHTAVAFWGSVVLDLREALWHDGLVIDAYAVMGSVEVVVDARTVVHVDGVGVMGDFSQSRDKVAPEIGPGSPTVRVRGLALMGSVTVRRRGPRSLGRGPHRALGH